MNTKNVLPVHDGIVVKVTTSLAWLAPKLNVVDVFEMSVPTVIPLKVICTVNPNGTVGLLSKERCPCHHDAGIVFNLRGVRIALEVVDRALGSLEPLGHRCLDLAE